jgi:hypothetical protein
MQIMPIINVTFKSFLPPESKFEKNDQTRDYWCEFVEECYKNPEHKNKLDELLQELANNGDNNILALEVKDRVLDGYNFRLYANNEDLLADRKERFFTGNRSLKDVQIKSTREKYSIDNYVVKGWDFLHIGSKQNQTFWKASDTEALLYCLEKIVRDPLKRMFDLKNIAPAKYLKQFRAKV